MPAPNSRKYSGCTLHAPVVQLSWISQKPNAMNNSHNHYRFGMRVRIHVTIAYMMNSGTMTRSAKTR